MSLYASQISIRINGGKNLTEFLPSLRTSLSLIPGSSTAPTEEPFSESPCLGNHSLSRSSKPLSRYNILYVEHFIGNSLRGDMKRSPINKFSQVFLCVLFLVPLPVFRDGFLWVEEIGVINCLWNYITGQSCHRSSKRSDPHY